MNASLRATTPVTMEPVTPQMLAAIREIEEISLAQCPQMEIETEHLFHAGLYARSIRLTAGTCMTNALIKRATVLIISGSVMILLNSGWVRLDGYNVIPASAGRKQIFVAVTDCELTMLFATGAGTVGEAEAEFTDESERLMSCHNNNRVTITGE